VLPNLIANVIIRELAAERKVRLEMSKQALLADFGAKSEESLFYAFPPFSRPGLPDFSWHNIPKWEKYTKITTKYTSWP
jgi:hypothetical protein